jgi:hypothetical protein
MEIKWNGYNSFTIKGNKVKVVLDPTKDMTKELDSEDIVITSSDTRFGFDGSKTPNVFNWPGEFESKGILIQNIATKFGPDEHRIIRIEVEGIRICNLGALTEEVSEEVLSEIGNVDILFLPLTLKTKYAMELVEEIDPKLVVLSMYNFEGSDEELPPVANILKEIGQTGLEAKDKLVIKSKSDLDTDNITYAYLTI